MDLDVQHTQSDETRELSFESFYDSYYRVLTLFAHQIVGNIDAAQDIVQEFFIRFWKDGKKKDPAFNYEAYFFQSVKHAALNHVRNGLRHEKAHQEISFQYASVEASPLQAEADDYEIIYKTINQLPADRKKVFEMVYIDGMKYQEVADKLGISFHTVKTQISRSLTFLREKLSKKQFTVLHFFLKKTQQL